MKKLRYSEKNLEDDIKAIRGKILVMQREIFKRRAIECERNSALEMPKFSDQDSHHDISHILRILGGKFSDSNKGIFCNQWKTLLVYSKDKAFSESDLNIMLLNCLGPKALNFYITEDIDLTMERKIQHLLTVFANIDSNLAERVRDLRDFKRYAFEPLPACMLRLGKIIKATNSMVKVDRKSVV